MKLVSLIPIRRGEWVIKASVFDDQILIFFWNECTMVFHTEMFYSEDTAYNFIESLYDSSPKTANR